MNLRIKTLGCALASIAVIAIAIAGVTPRDAAAVAEVAAAAAIVEASADAAAGVTFKIVPADVTSTKVSWAPLTGDGSN